MTTKALEAEIERRVREEVQREEAARLERIKAQVLEQQAREQAEGERRQRIAALRESIPADLDQAQLEVARTQLEAALDAYVATCRAYDTRYVQRWNEVLELRGSGPMPADMVAEPRSIAMGGVDYRKSRLQTKLAQIARAVFRRYYPLDQFDLGRPQD
jgi:multidrug efflux pump subunit AcrA (membrane-fusion protein)